MSNRKGKKTIGEDTARKIWLAGVGAYGRAFSEAQGSISKITKSGGKVFDDLVQKGEVIETMVSIKGKDVAEDVKDMASDVMDKVGVLDMDDRIAKMRRRLKRSDDDSADVDARLDGIEAKLDTILEMLAPKKPAPKKRATRKATPKKAVKKKAVTKKTPAPKAKK